ncbi:MAG: TRAP transporter substrate-binding protein [Candidatus Eiseniibacteriota bacterium]
MVKKTFMAVLVAGLACSAGAHAEAIKLKFAVFTPDKEMTFVNIMKPFAEHVAKASKGTLEFELFPNGALGRDPGKQMKMVQDGVADIAWIIPSYTPGVFPDDEVVELPGIIRDSKEGSIAIWRMWEKGLVRGYENLVPLAIFTSDPYTVHTNFTVNKLDDLKGKKIRAAGPVASDTVKAVGAVPVGMPFTQITESISRRVIDGTLAHPIALYDFGVAKVATHHYLARFGAVTLSIIMNKAKYDALPQAAKDAIMKYRGEPLSKAFGDMVIKRNNQLIAEWSKDKKHHVVRLNDAGEAEFMTTVAPVIAAWESKNPRHKQLLDGLQTELGRIRSGS